MHLLRPEIVLPFSRSLPDVEDRGDGDGLVFLGLILVSGMGIEDGNSVPLGGWVGAG